MTEAGLDGPAPAPEEGATMAPVDAEDRETVGQRASVWLYTTMERVAMSWPERSARALFQAYGRAGYHLMRSMRATVAKNYAQVLGRPADSPLVQAAVRDGFDLYARYWYETFRIRALGQTEMSERFDAHGIENLDRALEGGRGCIVALPHMGNWDAAGRYLALEGYPLVAAAEELKPRRMYELFLEHRRALGVEIVPLTEDRQAGAILAQMLAENWIVALVADRDLSGRGVEVEMFGRTRRLPAGPALLSLSTGAPLLPAPTYTTDRGWMCLIGEPIEVERSGTMRADVAALTRRLGEEFERAIAANPVDWHMFQPAWD